MQKKNLLSSKKGDTFIEDGVEMIALSDVSSDGIDEEDIANAIKSSSSDNEESFTN